MKIAFCLHGYVANSNGVNGAIMANQYMKDRILDRHDVDVFIHSWDIKNKDIALDLFKPTKSQFELQNEFESELQGYDEGWFFGDANSPPGMYSTNTIFRGMSFLYSRKRALEIRAEYERDNDFKYDAVVIARFDMGMRGKEHYQKYYATDFYFNGNANMDKLYSCYWQQLNWGIADHWFYSSSDNMSAVGSLYDCLGDYYNPESDYVKSVTEAWPESNSEDEFSNEMMKSERSTLLTSFPRWGCIDNHKLYKWHFMQTGLYDQCAFVDPNNGEIYETSR